MNNQQAPNEIVTFTEDEVEPIESLTPELTPYIPKLNNLAGDKVLAEKVRQWCYSQQQTFDSQAARTEFFKAGGTYDTADRMFRVSLTLDETSAQWQDTMSNVASTMSYRQTRTVHASLINVLFGTDDELPAEYEPSRNTQEYSDDVGDAIAKQRNMLMRHTFDEDTVAAKMKDGLLWNEVYGNYIFGAEWDRRYETREERVPVLWDEKGYPLAWRFEKVTRKIKDCPTLVKYALEDVWLDAYIEDLDLQRAILIQQQLPIEQLRGDEQAGFLMNTNKVNALHLADGTGENDEVKRNRQANAGESTSSEINGLIETWQCKIQVPIKESKSEGKGKWSPKNTPCARYWATFAGKLSDSNAVCVRLIKNPFSHGKCGLKAIHSEPDNKGFYHDPMSKKLKSNYYQATTNLNQAFDCNTLRVKAPFVSDGPIHTRDLRFRANKLITVQRGTTLTKMDIPDVTGGTMDMASRIEDDSNKTSGADKALTGEPMPGRQSATADRRIYETAKLPIIIKADYISDQIFPWWYEMAAYLWEQFSDPNMVVAVSGNQFIQEIKPANLFGPFKVRITAVHKFENNMIRRQELQGVAQSAMPWAQGAMGPKGLRAFSREFFKVFGFRNVNEIFPENGDYDARQRAINENHTMLIVGRWVEPQASENHDTHLSIHEPAVDEYGYLPDADQDPNKSRMGMAHIQIHKNFKQQQTTQGAAPQANVPQGLPGEMGMNQIEAQAGAVANT